MKVVIGYKGKSYVLELQKEREASLYGMKIGDTFDGAVIGAAGYLLQIRGGSDKDGFPMRADLQGGGKLKVMLSSSPGFRGGKKGERRRKMVRGSVVNEWISQLNVAVIKEGPTPLDQIFISSSGGDKEKKEKKEEK